ncbi:hypothetical protein PT974_01497 [Cladobotryum mycophilum]|uniref:Cation/H+ exchanger transmembrane domain-containing protein n=1 Tax=Cladobotryum mycophilum TaxID=491253 RepID=A0ABR0T3S5_9HYPO
MSTESVEAPSSLPYHEPSIVTLLTQASFLLAANLLNHVVDSLLYCGLIGQILVGVAWGTPGSKILPTEVETTIVQLGYIGLILIVFEGGLSTDFRSLKANIFLSTAVALTGIGVPISLSFILKTLVGASDLECFAAGAALCSTSLGTTFTVLRSSGLVNSRLGVVLASAAMLDDVVGLVMVQVVANLGTTSESISAAIIVRPLMVSLAFVVLTPCMCLLLVKPLTLALNRHRQIHSNGLVDGMLRKGSTAMIIHTLFLVGMVTAASYAGTSNLFSAYLAGAVISWWDLEVPHPDGAGTQDPQQQQQQQQQHQQQDTDAAASVPNILQADAVEDADAVCDASGQAVYRTYYEPVVHRVLQPFFFASIGFSIPVARMFSGQIVWKGLVYAVLMGLGKLACGVWLIRFHGLATCVRDMLVSAAASVSAAVEVGRWKPSAEKRKQQNDGGGGGGGPGTQSDSGVVREGKSDGVGEAGEQGLGSSNITEPATAVLGQASDSARETMTMVIGPSSTSPSPTKPLSLYPAAILGFAMVARGEIGFLISSVAESRGVFGGGDGGDGDTAGDSGESEMFLLVTWAIVVCTILGPLCTGLLVRRVRVLEGNKRERGSGQGSETTMIRGTVLGAWGPPT